MPTRLRRNDLCPCGSGKKYKKCCLGLGPGPAPALPQRPPASGWQTVEDDSDIDSNRVVDLIDAGKLDEAERQCELLRERYPRDIDWLERYAMVYEAREDWAKAHEYYGRAAAYAEAHEGDFDPDLIADFHACASRMSARLGEHGVARPDRDPEVETRS